MACLWKTCAGRAAARVFPSSGTESADSSPAAEPTRRAHPAAPWTPGEQAAPSILAGYDSPVCSMTGDAIDRIAAFGVVALMFTMGLELSFERLRRMRHLVFGLGLAQVAVTTLILGAAAWRLGLAPPSALAIGAALSMSSTAIVIPMLVESKRLHSVAGRASLAVLLFQDLAVAPLLVMVGVFSAGGGRLVTWGNDGTALVWDGKHLAPPAVLPPAPKPGELLTLWEDLAAAQAGRAYNARAPSSPDGHHLPPHHPLRPHAAPSRADPSRMWAARGDSRSRHAVEGWGVRDKER